LYTKGVNDGWQADIHNRAIERRHKRTNASQHEYHPFIGLLRPVGVSMPASWRSCNKLVSGIGMT
jgi:hypothetical protein